MRCCKGPLKPLLDFDDGVYWQAPERKKSPPARRGSFAEQPQVTVGRKMMQVPHVGLTWFSSLYSKGMVDCAIYVHPCPVIRLFRLNASQVAKHLGVGIKVFQPKPRVKGAENESGGGLASRAPRNLEVSFPSKYQPTSKAIAPWEMMPLPI